MTDTSRTQQVGATAATDAADPPQAFFAPQGVMTQQAAGPYPASAAMAAAIPPANASAQAQGLPPLLDLPPPPTVEEENASLVPPAEIIVESIRRLTGRILRRWALIVAVLWPLWLLLIALYVYGVSPTFWFFGWIVALADPQTFALYMRMFGFSVRNLAVAFLIVPPVATGLSVALAPIASRWIAPMNPRSYLSERAFHKAVATRFTVVMMAPPVIVTAVCVFITATRMGWHWVTLSSGPLTSICLAVLALLIAGAIFRNTSVASRILAMPSSATIETIAHSHPDPDKRAQAARITLAQDRRHLPPHPDSREAAPALSPRALARSLGATMWEGLIWAAPVFAATFTMVFLFTDFVMFGTASDFDPTSQDVARQFIATWQVVTVATPLSLLWLLGIAAAPGLAMAMSKGARIGVLDERPYPRWSDRAAVNLWEKKVVERSAWLVAAITAIVIILGTVAVGVLGGGNALVYACGVLLLLSAPPAWAMASMVAMRTQLRTVIYGPPGRYMRRDCPYALVAPAYGTRTERGKDPAVRAALRARMRADGSSDQDVLAQIDEIGEKLWLGSDELSTAERRVDPALIEQGQLPDFGGAAAAPAAHRVRAPERMDIPDTLEETAAQ